MAQSLLAIDALRTPDTPDFASPPATPMYRPRTTDMFLNRAAGTLSYQTPETPKMPSPVHSQFIASIQQRAEKSRKASPQTPYVHTKNFNKDENHLVDGTVESFKRTLQNIQSQKRETPHPKTPLSISNTPILSRNHTINFNLQTPVSKTPTGLFKTPSYHSNPIQSTPQSSLKSIPQTPAAFTPYRPTPGNTTKLVLPQQFTDSDFHEPDVLELSPAFFDNFQMNGVEPDEEQGEIDSAFLESFNALLFPSENATPYPAFNLQQLEVLLMPFDSQMIWNHLYDLVDQKMLEEFEIFDERYWRCCSKPL